MVHYRVHRDPRSSHQQISKLVRELRLSPILDVGAAQGMLGHSLQDTGFTIDGIEANPQWAEMARPYYRQVWSSYAEQAPLEPKTYQLVVCGDVLEHTPDPVGVLKKLIEATTDDAKFIISVPNVAHLAIRMMLLFGKFPKMERGILDKTHLQFLTKDTALDMLRQAGLRAERVSCTGVPLDELWKGGEGKLLYKLMTRSQHLALAIAPRLFGFQWIFLASRATAPAAGG
jgi:2-polyprenyl-3-methyl-5-hydroxy-6-metoxy-1,4-benzoquinol methylase